MPPPHMFKEMSSRNVSKLYDGHFLRTLLLSLCELGYGAWPHKFKWRSLHRARPALCKQSLADNGNQAIPSKLNWRLTLAKANCQYDAGTFGNDKRDRRSTAWLLRSFLEMSRNCTMPISYEHCCSAFVNSATALGPTNSNGETYTARALQCSSSRWRTMGIKPSKLNWRLTLAKADCQYDARTFGNDTRDCRSTAWPLLTTSALCPTLLCKFHCG